jgi:nucleoside-diphosphate-sugar epimerase
MRILVTGGAGFIGSHIAERYVQLGHDVVVLDNLSTGLQGNVPDGARLVEGDVRNLWTCREACVGVDVVFHEAALGSVPRSVIDPMTSFEVNAGGTLNVLEAARRAGVKRFVYAASSSAYGGASGPLREGMTPTPRSPYAASKLAGEHLCSAFWTSYGLRTISLRYFNVFGPRQRPDGPYAAVIPRWADAMLRGHRPVVHGDGKQTRDFTYVENVVRASVLAAESDLPEPAFGQVYNVGCGASTTLLDLATSLAAALGVRADPEFSDPRPGDVLHSLACTDEVRKTLGYSPFVSLDDGLQKYANWICRAS